MSASNPFSAEFPRLLERHLAELRDGSGLPLDVIRERGYRSAMGEKELADLGFAGYQRRAPALVVPVCPPDGSNGLYQIKPDAPRPGRDRKPVKYETPEGRSVRIDVPPRCRPLLADAAVPLWITEGAKKADALAARGLCAIDLPGVWSFVGPDIFGQRAFLADFALVALDGRDVRILYDSDVSVKDAVRRAMAALGRCLTERGARVRAYQLPAGPSGEKVGADDFLLTHGPADLDALPFVSFGGSSRYVGAVSWPEPDPVDGPPPAPVLPLPLVPREIADVSDDAAERIGCPVDYLVWANLVSSATLIGREAGIRPKRQDDWTERMALDVALVGDPSWLKTPALAEATRPLRRQQAADEEAHASALEQWRKDCAQLAADGGADELPPKPVLRRCVTADATVEKLATLLLPEASRGLAIVRDELAGWFRDLNKYRAGGDREFYLQAYSGGPYTVDRIGRGTQFVPDLLVSVLGGIQPDKAVDIFAGGPDDGLSARFTCIWPAAPFGDDDDRWPDKDGRTALDKVNDVLATTDWRAALWTDDYHPTAYCRLDDEGASLFAAWRARLRADLRAGRHEGRMAERVGKYPGLAARLVLLFHLIENAARRCPNARTPAAATVDRVIRLMDAYVLPMDRRVHAQFAVTAAAAGGRRIARWLRETRPERFTARDVRRHGWSGLDTPETVAAALEWLAARRWVREEAADPFAKGRPPVAYLTNPRIPTEGAR